jgi:glycosyltransferase involved in cell wall biosynthesis
MWEVNPMMVSAVIPAFNRRNHVSRAIDSALAQTVPVDEILVIDDGSTDGTAEAVESRYGSRVRVIRQSNTGVAGARLRGIQEAHGAWIAFLDSDDEWLPDRNGELLRAVQHVPADVAWIFGALRIVTDSGEGLTLFEEHGLVIRESPRVFADSLEIQFPYQFPMLQASLIRRDALLKLNCFSEGLRSDDDLLAGFQIACCYRFAAVPSVVGRYFRTSDLTASSVVVNGNFGPDYHRSRMLAFERVIQSGRRRPWNRYYASSVRGLCQVLARRGTYVRRLAWQQFRYGGVSTKGIAFLGAANLGPWALQAWDWGAEFARRYHNSATRTSLKENGLQAYFESLYRKSDR